MPSNPKMPKKRIVSRLLLAFAALSLVTSFFLSFSGEEQILAETVPSTGGTIGPFEIEEAGTVLTARVRQTLPVNTWSSVSLGLLNAQKQYLIGFGDGLWHEQGYDEGYYWNEAVSAFEGTVTIAEPGQYYLEATPESNLSAIQQRNNPIRVTASTQGFSSIPHFGAGIVALIAGLLLNFFGKGTAYTMLKES